MSSPPSGINAPAFRIVSEANDEGFFRLAQGVRIAEALLFASHSPLGAEEIARVMPAGVDVEAVLGELERVYRTRGMMLERLAGKWMFRTAPDLAHLFAGEKDEPRKLSRAALETLAIIAYHQPVTRAEIEDVRGVSCHRGTLDLLLDAGFIRLRGRRRSPGRPVTFGTSEAFLIHFGLDKVTDLPRLDELEGAGMVEGKLPSGLFVPHPSDDLALRADEEALEPDLIDTMREARLDAAADEPPLDPDGNDGPRDKLTPSPE